MFSYTRETCRFFSLLPFAQYQNHNAEGDNNEQETNNHKSLPEENVRTVNVTVSSQVDQTGRPKRLRRGNFILTTFNPRRVSKPAKTSFVSPVFSAIDAMPYTKKPPTPTQKTSVKLVGTPTPIQEAVPSAAQCFLYRMPTTKSGSQTLLMSWSVCVSSEPLTRARSDSLKESLAMANRL